MTNTHPHYLYSDVVNSLKNTKAVLTAMTGLLDGSIGYATDTNEFGTYSTDTGTWTWLGTGGTRTNAFQRNLANDLSLLDGECLIVLDYINAGAYNITLSGDVHLRILF